MDKTSKYYYKLFKESTEYESKRFDKQAELVAFYELEQDNLPNYSGEKPWVYNLSTPYATDAINLRVASLQANDYIGQLEPLSPEDVEDVDNLNNIYREFWEEMNMNKIIDDSILTAAVVGQAYTHIIYDSEPLVGARNRRRQGKLIPYFLDSTSVRIDPKSLSLKDADYVCVVERISKKKVKRDYPDLDWDSKENGLERSSAEQRGEIFYGTDYVSTRDDDIFSKITVYEKVKDVIEKTVLVETMIVEDTVEFPLKFYPIAQLKWQKKLKSPYGTSLLEMLLPLQKVVNEIESANANANMQYSSPSFVLSEDAGIDPEDLALSSGAPGSVYVVASGQNIENMLKPLMPDRGIDQGLVMTKQELERAIYKLAGITDQFNGSLGTVGNTSTGADLAIQRSKVIENRVLSNIEEYVEDLTNIIVAFISEGFAGETIYGRGERQSDNQFQFKEFKVPEDAAEIHYSFYIKLNIRTQYSKEQNKVLIRELFEVERQYDTGDVKGLTFLDVLKTYDIPQTRELVDRYKQLTKMDAEQRAMLVSEIATTGATLGIDPTMTNAAITEIMLNKVETPAVEQFMQMAEQVQMTQQTQAAETSDIIVQNDLAQQQATVQEAENEPIGMQ